MSGLWQLFGLAVIIGAFVSWGIRCYRKGRANLIREITQQAEQLARMYEMPPEHWSHPARVRRMADSLANYGLRQLLPYIKEEYRNGLEVWLSVRINAALQAAYETRDYGEFLRLEGELNTLILNYAGELNDGWRKRAEYKRAVTELGETVRYRWLKKYIRRMQREGNLLKNPEFFEDARQMYDWLDSRGVKISAYEGVIANGVVLMTMRAIDSGAIVAEDIPVTPGVQRALAGLQSITA